jgi:hypothetical protein
MHPGSPEGTTIPLPRLHPAATTPVTWALVNSRANDTQRVDADVASQVGPGFDGLITLTDVTGAKRKTADIVVH